MADGAVKENDAATKFADGDFGLAVGWPPTNWASTGPKAPSLPRLNPPAQPITPVSNEVT
jgi:hypothetical protein